MGRLFAHWCTHLGSSVTDDKLFFQFVVVECAILISGYILSLCSPGGVLRDQPGFLRELGLYGGHAGEQRWHQSDQVRRLVAKKGASVL